MIKDLINLANDLDQKGLRKEADFLDKIIKQAGDIFSFPEDHQGSNKPQMTSGEVVDFGQRRKEKEINEKINISIILYNNFWSRS